MLVQMPPSLPGWTIKSQIEVEFHPIEFWTRQDGKGALMKNKEGTCLTATPSSLIHYLFNFYENTRCTKVVIISILCVEMSDFFGRLAMEGAGKAGITHRKKNTPCSVFFL